MALIENKRLVGYDQSLEDLSHFITWKRGFLEIIAEILEALSERPLKKTHVTFRCNIDSRAVTKYLKLLTRANFVKQINNDGSFYVPTKKGMKFLKEYLELVKILNEKR